MNTTTTPLDPPVNNPPHNSSGADSGAICERVQPRARPSKAELWLEPSPELPRKLHVELSSGGWLYVRVCAKNHMLIGLSGERLADCYVDVSQSECEFLSLGHASFMLSADEVTQVRATFEPLGLRIRETDS